MQLPEYPNLSRAQNWKTTATILADKGFADELFVYGALNVGVNL